VGGKPGAIDPDGPIAPSFAKAAMLKCSNFLPDLIAATNHHGFNPRPAQVLAGFPGSNQVSRVNTAS
jgi:hypothetical protein